MLTADEVMAIARLRQWGMDRMALRSARATNYRRVGWNQRDACNFDARQVRVLDFERVLDRLGEEEKAALIMKYRDGDTAKRIASTLHCSTRKVDYLANSARLKLTAFLDKLGLL